LTFSSKFHIIVKRRIPGLHFYVIKSGLGSRPELPGAHELPERPSLGATAKIVGWELTPIQKKKRVDGVTAQSRAPVVGVARHFIKAV
jgi:hypothetical protein